MLSGGEEEEEEEEEERERERTREMRGLLVVVGYIRKIKKREDCWTIERGSCKRWYICAT